ncbi:hypothetical protein CW304_11835 [Bacillus sp. UFRGS-B20]|nr:hypothetical protein CW304_11835 [Bacillus sp. UFRGS-B20]
MGSLLASNRAYCRHQFSHTVMSLGKCNFYRRLRAIKSIPSPSVPKFLECSHCVFPNHESHLRLYSLTALDFRRPVFMKGIEMIIRDQT